MADRLIAADQEQQDLVTIWSILQPGALDLCGPRRDADQVVDRLGSSRRSIIPVMYSL